MAHSRYIQLIYLLLTATVNGTQQIHPVIYLLLTVTVNAIQQIHPVIYLLLSVTVNGTQQIHPVDISPIDSHCMQQIHPVIYLLLTVTACNRYIQWYISYWQSLLMPCSRYIQLIYLLLSVTVNGTQQIHPVDISPIKAQPQLIVYGLWGFYRVII